MTASCTCGPIAKKHNLPHMNPCPLYVKRKYDMAADYRKAGLAVYADHCIGCGSYAHVIACNHTVDEIVWSRTICERCGIKESESEWHPNSGWITREVPVSTL